MAQEMTRTLTANVYPQDSFKLTVLFNIVIGIVVSTPGSHLESPVKTLSALPSASTPLQWQWINREKTHRDDSGVVGQKVTWGDVTRLVLSASNVQRQLNRTLWTKIITGTVLQEDTGK